MNIQGVILTTGSRDQHDKHWRRPDNSILLPESMIHDHHLFLQMYISFTLDIFSQVYLISNLAHWLNKRCSTKREYALKK